MRYWATVLRRFSEGEGTWHWRTGMRSVRQSGPARPPGAPPL